MLKQSLSRLRKCVASITGAAARRKGDTRRPRADNA
jgi:hypothetical protein